LNCIEIFCLCHCCQFE